MVFNTDLILKSLSECSFFELCEDSCYTQIVDCCDSTFFNIKKWGKGATKVVLFPIKGDYVVKIPFSHDSYHYDYEEDEELPYFCGANEPDGWDYCKAEMLFYEEAEAVGVEFCFLKNELLGTVHDHPIYIQEYAEMVKDKSSHTPKDWKSTKETESYCRSKGYWCFNSYWITDFLNYYGEEKFKLLSQFLEDNDIHDLHSGNLGYIGSKPVIIDYAGYYE